MPFGGFFRAAYTISTTRRDRLSRSVLRYPESNRGIGAFAHAFPLGYSAFSWRRCSESNRGLMGCNQPSYHLTTAPKIWSSQGDLNSHGVAPTDPSSQRVYQFRHARLCLFQSPACSSAIAAHTFSTARFSLIAAKFFERLPDMAS